VKDCVDVMIWLMNHRDVNGLFNLGTGKAQTWVELMGALYAAVDKEMKVRWVDTPEEIRDRYQYFTQAEMGRLRSAGYDRPFLPAEQGVADYVKNHLLKDDPYR
jgi:ADP-L-glycero-D-manno-heptose 6-epimerase